VTPADAPSAPSAAAVTAFAGARPLATAPSEVNAVPGSSADKTLRPRPGMPVPEGRLTLDSTPWSAVYLGGQLLGQTPLVELALPVGDHALELVNPDQGISTTYVVHVESGKTTVRRVGLEKPGAPQ
jgi:serine/threonine-protein kinase